VSFSLHGFSGFVDMLSDILSVLAYVHLWSSLAFIVMNLALEAALQSGHLQS
jgi:hypothetical protein